MTSVSTIPSPNAVTGFDLLIDAEGELHRSYGVTGPAFYLIRPDGYVGLRGPGYYPERVALYLDSVSAFGGALAKVASP